MARQAATRQPSPTPTPTEVPDRLPSVALMGLTTLLLVQALRVLFPLAYNLGERTSFITAGVFALALSFSPFVAPLLIRPLGLRRAVAGAVSGLALARLTIQVVHPVPLWLASVAVVLGLLALTTVVVAMRGGRRLAAGIVLGLAVDTALRSASWTWDYAWQDGFLPIALTVAAGAGAALLAFRVSPLERTPVRGVLGHVALGPFLFLQTAVPSEPGICGLRGRLLASMGHGVRTHQRRDGPLVPRVRRPQLPPGMVGGRAGAGGHRRSPPLHRPGAADRDPDRAGDGRVATRPGPPDLSAG
ncbi:MAG: hypothetical protein ACRDH8_13565 [Actinomycetota bacterium]